MQKVRGQDMAFAQRLNVSVLTAAAVAAAFWAPGSAAAEPRVFPYEGVANHCPAGQQPVSMDGVICCGVPNQTVSYQAMMRHGSTARPRMTRVSSANSYGTICPEGQKGCYSN